MSRKRSMLNSYLVNRAGTGEFQKTYKLLYGNQRLVSKSSRVDAQRICTDEAENEIERLTKELVTKKGQRTWLGSVQKNLCSNST